MSATELFNNLELDDNNPTPLYLQLQSQIRKLAQNGTLHSGHAIPSERNIADALGVSRITVRKAVQDLVDEGLLIQRQGSGTFIAEPAGDPLHQSLTLLGSFSEDIRARGMEPGSRWISRELAPANSEELFALGLSPGDRVSRICRVRLADGEPMALEISTVPASYLPDPRAIKHSLYEALNKRRCRPVRALQRLAVRTLNSEQAELLGQPRRTPALYIVRNGFLASGDRVEYTESYYRSDRYDFVIELQAGQNGN